ncbi:MAG: ATP-dependent Clp protease proteolytic subunit [Gallionella sp.]|nr:ATP-dependent Clp protease proteolytic subunit [Gallionella sp.]
MPVWGKVLTEIGLKQQGGHTAVDSVRRKYLKLLHKHTGRNIVAYYSGWLYRPPSTPNLGVGDEDMNGFMAAVHRLDRSKGLDLILHTPGGDIAATEALVNYLWTMFGKDIRVIVPQLAMSAGTMIACSAKSIVMGKQSSLGPIDPQIGGVPAQGVLDEFQLAVRSIEQNPASAPLWQQIVSKYHPSFLNECTQAISWSSEMVKGWLCQNMFAGSSECDGKASAIVSYLGNHTITGAHARHVPLQKCVDIGLKIEKLEDDPVLQDLVLTVHHAYMHTFSMHAATKAIENHLGVATVLMGAPQPVLRPQQVQTALDLLNIKPQPQNDGQPVATTPTENQ